MRILLALMVFVVSVSGCSLFNPTGSDQLDCGMPKGVSCKNPREVYKLTDKDKIKGKSAGEIPTYVFANAPHDESSLKPMPVLEQARVMRVWIAPWIDRNDDQHWPGLVFTVIQAKKWHFGQAEFEGIEPSVPHKMYESAQLPPASATNSSTGSVDMPKNEDEVLN